MENLEFLRIFFFYLKEETLLKLGGNFFRNSLFDDAFISTVSTDKQSYELRF